MMKIALFPLTLIILPSLAFSAPCDEQSVLRFQARTQCWEKNNARTCDSLPWLEGTAAAAGLAAKAKVSPEYAELKKFMNSYQQTSLRMMEDYRAVLDKYYELRKKSEPGVRRPASELSAAEYEKYAVEIKKALPKNIFIENAENIKINEGGWESANDIIQRTNMIAMKKAGVQIRAFRFENTYFKALELDLARAKLIFRKASILNGFSENGNVTFSGPAMRREMTKLERETKSAMRTDLSVEAKLKQAGRASIKGMMAAGGVAAALLPVVDLNLKRAAVANCAQSFGVKFNEEETIEFSRAIDLKDTLKNSSLGCDNMTFTEGGVGNLFAKGMTDGNAQKFMCGFEEKLALEQDKEDLQVEWNHENCVAKSSSKAATSATLGADRATIVTASGTEVEVQWNAKGEWNYSSLKSLNDKDFGQYLIDKVKHPMNKDIVNSGYVNPRSLCASPEKGKFPGELCEISRAMRNLSQNREIAEATCASKTASPAGSTKSLNNAR